MAYHHPFFQCPRNLHNGKNQPKHITVIQNPIKKKVDLEKEAIAATIRIANFNESNTPTLNIYIDVRSQTNSTEILITIFKCNFRPYPEVIT